eukprot:GHRQ01020030.1.p1 GENE.GHRQ01020030.1~~GHRQ01020030.1.p1  ORF type:complete len:115 (+),score=17.69 GHRQ01020030.1:450-794(+)
MQHSGQPACLTTTTGSRSQLMLHNPAPAAAGPPDTKRCASSGWNCTLVTKSLCQNWRRQPGCDRCHSRTLLSSEPLSRKPPGQHTRHTTPHVAAARSSACVACAAGKRALLGAE